MWQQAIRVVITSSRDHSCCAVMITVSCICKVGFGGSGFMAVSAPDILSAIAWKSGSDGDGKSACRWAG